ncbi:kinase and exchange factor for Rac A-like [Ceratitis capitata]|uniref:kinase and exchange factor for Rac A-like n=1 Tax=Ceratitis capitata TaxID=7213 RepID=UPI000C6C6701|nr:kinase and exchange factor for Rac A-like [Ceratitis capitata]
MVKAVTARATATTAALYVANQQLQLQQDQPNAKNATQQQQQQQREQNYFFTPQSQRSQKHSSAVDAEVVEEGEPCGKRIAVASPSKMVIPSSAATAVTNSSSTSTAASTSTATGVATHNSNTNAADGTTPASQKAEVRSGRAG